MSLKNCPQKQIFYPECLFKVTKTENEEISSSVVQKGNVYSCSVTFSQFLVVLCASSSAPHGLSTASFSNVHTAKELA